jgi:3-oxoacid CoA-transferase subunit B
MDAPKSNLDHQTMAMRVAKELPDGSHANLGIGLPGLVAHFILPDKTVIIQSESGILGMGPLILEEDKMDHDIVNAAVHPVSVIPGAAFFDLRESFDMIRGKHLDVTVLGGLQVSEKGDLANWLVPGKKAGAMGGALDLAVGAKRLIVMMDHVTKDGKPRILRECTYPLTGRKCVDLVITDIAVIEVIEEGLLLKEVAPGWEPSEIQALTEATLIVRDVKEIEL